MLSDSESTFLDQIHTWYFPQSLYIFIGCFTEVMQGYFTNFEKQVHKEILLFKPYTVKGSFNCMFLSCHVRVSTSKSTLYSCLNVKELLALNRRDIWSLSDYNGIQTHNHLFQGKTLNHLAKLASLAKWLSVRLQAKWLCVRIPLQSFKVSFEYWNLFCIHIKLSCPVHFRSYIKIKTGKKDGTGRSKK